MRFHHILALATTVGVASASKCKPTIPPDSSKSASSTASSVSSVSSAASSASSAPSSLSSASSSSSISNSAVVSAGSSSIINSVSSVSSSSIVSSVSVPSSVSSASSSSSVSSSFVSSPSSSASSVSSSSVVSSVSVPSSVSSASSSSSVSSSFVSSPSSSASSVSSASSASSVKSSSSISTSSSGSSASSASSVSFVSSVSSSSFSSVASVPSPSQICQQYGSRPNTQPLGTFTDISDDTFNGCSAQCAATDGCNSFSIQVETGGICTLYATALYLDFTFGTSGPTIYFDLNCPAPVVSGPSVAYISPSVSVPAELYAAPVISIAASSAYVAPSVVQTDSPPYVPSGPQAKPSDDNAFISTYTYTEFTLTMNSTGSPPVATGIPQPSGSELPDLPCLITPGPVAPFTVLNQQFVPMVSTTGSIGPLLQPTEAPQPGDPLLDPATLELPTFFLQEVDGADAYDMVYNGDSPLYVAMTTDGQVILVDASTGPQFVDGVVTTIFNINCIGVMTITLNGQSYVWTTTGATCQIQQGSSTTSFMKAIPETMPTVPQTDQTRKRSERLFNDLMAREEMNKLTTRQFTPTNGDFSAPQCPNTPAGLVSETKAGYQLGQGNLCNAMSSNWDYSPYDFGDACTVQSNCYDHCSGYSFQGCNTIFYTTMLAICLQEIGDEWWDVVSLIACDLQAVYYLGVAETSTGRNAYYDALGAMCACFCSSPDSTCLSPLSSNGFYCADIYSNDNDNCGACGGQCGANSACHGGVCGCPNDQCGDICLNFESDPFHCGNCTNECDPPYCISGSCYVPQPGTCAPDQSVTNNMFATYSPTWANWTVGAYAGTTLGTNLDFGPTLFTDQSGNQVYAMGVTMVNITSGGFHGYIEQKNVKMCPGFNYDLTFSMGYVNEINGQLVSSLADCEVRWLTGKPDVWSDDDGFQSSPNYPIGASNPTYATFGPWTLNVVEGETGVTKTSFNYYVDLTAVVSCNTPVDSSGYFIITDVLLTPTSAVTPTTKREAEKLTPLNFDLRERGSEEYTVTFDEGDLSTSKYTKAPAIKGRVAK
ncbi:hypothetical protein Sste5346_004187 [Sporothrix stenoceras]|uniref:Apple domain-containing protein n=1 Tax=Sporothrix stenoceras TaxID=5173 RepID=A0ABR3ZAV2_9PEZI